MNFGADFSIAVASRESSEGFQTGISVSSGHRHERARRGVGENVRDFAVAIEDVDGYEDHAQLYAGEINVDHLRAVDEVDAKPVACAETSLGEQAGEPVLRESSSPKVETRPSNSRATASRRSFNERSKRCRGSLGILPERYHADANPLMRYCGFQCRLRQVSLLLLLLLGRCRERPPVRLKVLIGATTIVAARARSPSRTRSS